MRYAAYIFVDLSTPQPSNSQPLIPLPITLKIWLNRCYKKRQKIRNRNLVAILYLYLFGYYRSNLLSQQISYQSNVVFLGDFELIQVSGYFSYQTAKYVVEAGARSNLLPERPKRFDLKV